MTPNEYRLSGILWAFDPLGFLMEDTIEAGSYDQLAKNLLANSSLARTQQHVRTMLVANRVKDVNPEMLATVAGFVLAYH